MRFGVGPIGTFPLYAPFDSGNDMGRATYGGSWSTVAEGGTQRQTGTGSDGPKQTAPVSGDAFTVSSDVKITSLSAPSGNGGVVARVNSPGIGPDAYLGYFAGVDGSTWRFRSAAPAPALGRRSLTPRCPAAWP